MSGAPRRRLRRSGCSSARCRYCGKTFHSGNSLRLHVAGQHPAEYAKSPHSVKRHKAPLKRKSVLKLEQRPRSARPHAKPKRDSPQPQETEHSTTDLRAREDPERTRRVWEEVLRRQQLQRDTTGRKHHARNQNR